MRYGPCLAGNLKNLVLSDQGTKHCGSALGPDTSSGPAATAVVTPEARPATSVERSTAKHCGRRAIVISILPATWSSRKFLGFFSLALRGGLSFATLAAAGFATRRRTLCLTARRTASEPARRV